MLEIIREVLEPLFLQTGGVFLWTQTKHRVKKFWSTSVAVLRVVFSAFGLKETLYTHWSELALVDSLKGAWSVEFIQNINWKEFRMNQELQNLYLL